MTIADNPEALAGFVRHLGGEIVEAPTFRFEIPLAETRRVIPEINKLGLRCERISERTGTDPNNGNAITVATIELRRQPEKSAYQTQPAAFSQPRSVSPSPAAPPDRSSLYAAPVSRTAPSGGYREPSAKSVRLSPIEQEIARGLKISDVEYAQGKLRLAREKATGERQQ